MKPSESDEKSVRKVVFCDHFQDFFEIFPSLVNQDTKDRLKKNKGKRRGERVVCIIADFQILLFEIIFPIRCLEKRKKKKIKREI